MSGEYSGMQAKSDLLGGVLNYLVYEEVGEKGLERLATKAEKILEGMTGSQMKMVVAAMLRDPSGDLLNVINQVKEVTP